MEASPIRLAAGRVSVWVADARPEADPALLRFLPEEELARCGRYLREEDRRTCRTARLLTRWVLARATGIEPGSLSLCSTERGRPFLPAPDGGLHPVRFSLAHSGGLVALALSIGADIGLDLEDTSRPIDREALARRFFSPGEASSLACLPEALRPSRFFALWTLKEACFKALSGGVFMGLSRAVFGFPALGEISASFSPKLPAQAASLCFALAEPRPGWLAALAHPGPFEAEFFACSPFLSEEPLPARVLALSPLAP